MAPKGNPKQCSFKFVLDEDERNMMMALAHDENLSAATWLRRLIRREFEAHGDPKRKQAEARYFKSLREV